MIDPLSVYPLEITDAGRQYSDWILERNDCTVRALAIATNETYDAVHEELRRAGRRTHRGFELTEYLARRRTFLGHSLKRTTFRRHATITEVIEALGQGSYVVDLDDHVLAVVDGTARDLIRVPQTERVLGVWRFDA